VGDKVLAKSEWKAEGESLSYEPITDVMVTPMQPRRVVDIWLEDGTHLTATEGHPFKTPEGWRDAIVLKKGGKLLLPGEAQGMVEITQIAHRVEALTTYNLEVANAHTFFVGNDGVLVHNGHGHHSWPKYLGGAKKQDLVDLDPDLHREYHSGLDKVLPRCKGTKHYAAKRGKQRGQMYDDFRDYTDGFDSANGTDLLGAARRNGFPR
ncbi:MAG: hypothetical protein ING36_08365, partial [Burkholderiales bacterium]|nr:hypothetical protein [Burkholderiales bacterium]